MLVAGGVLSGVASAQLPRLEDAYPADAPFVPAGKNIQRALDQHGAVRLASGDHGRATVRLKSGQRIYGLPGTRLGKVVVEPGTRGALVWRVSTTVEFPPSRVSTKHVCIARTENRIDIRNAIVEECLFLDTRGAHIDLRESGYLRDNRFVRMVLQSKSRLDFRGNSREPSYNNVFLWLNPLCPDIAPIYLDELRDVTIVGMDAETWLFKVGGTDAMFRTGRVGTLRIFGAQGGNHNPVDKRTPVLDTAAEEVQLYGFWTYCHDVKPNMILREGNKRLFTSGSRKYELQIPASNGLTVLAHEDGATGRDVLRQNGDDAAELKSMLVPEGRDGEPWERPTFAEIPDPVGSDWRDGLDDRPDHTAALQKRINDEGIVVLEAGTYYISEPLRINYLRGIVGAGMGRTAIVAKKRDMSMFRVDGRDRPNRVTLANLTLQGGGVGLHIRSEDIGPYISRAYVSHVQFRDMAVAGIYVDMPRGEGVQSMDNNIFSQCVFNRCASGVKQRAATRGNAGFLDKNLFYGCQFVDCGFGLELIANRCNNLNSCINCLFTRCRDGVARMRHSLTTTFANCDFVNNGGDPVIQSDRGIVLVSCRFEAGAGASSLLPSASLAEGCTFEPIGMARCTVVKAPARNHFHNCTSRFPIGRLREGMLTNNAFAADAHYSGLAVAVSSGTPTVVMRGAPQPSPQMLFGANLGGVPRGAKPKARARSEEAGARPRRKVHADAVAMFDGLLRDAVRGALSRGREVGFHLQTMRARVLVRAIDDDGTLAVSVARPRTDMSVAFARLSFDDRKALALATLRDNDEGAHALVAFYALCARDDAVAQEHLRASGSMRADVEGMFVPE